MTITIPQRVLDRIFVDATRDEATGCLISRYSIASNGYSQIGWWEGGKAHMTTGHRAAWTAVNGPIPEALTVDHMCFNRPCIEPSHLRLLPNFENARRTRGRDWPIGQCVRGHDNRHLYKKGKARVCRICTAEDRLTYAERRTF